MVITIARKIPSNSMENTLKDVDIIKNQNVNPAVTANAFIRGEKKSILNRIDECY
jgi:signal peptidase I